MRRSLHRLIALCLVLLWGPVTMCCALEAAGLETLCASEACHSSDETAVPLDGCNLLEAGDFQSVIPTIKTAPPATLVGVCLICLTTVAEPPSSIQATAFRDYERPRHWTVTWQFERRAAALAHAPDSLLG